MRRAAGVPAGEHVNAVIPDGRPQVDTRVAIGAARTIVVKVGSSSLTTAAGGLDAARLDALVDALAARAETGSNVVLVSSGAIAAGLAPLGLRRRPRDLPTQQAAASVGQQQLAARYADSFSRHGLKVGQVLLTTDDVVRRAHYRNAQRTFARLLHFGVVPVVARGIVGHDAAELPAIIGRHLADLPMEQRREVVHADDLVVVRHPARRGKAPA